MYKGPERRKYKRVQGPFHVDFKSLTPEGQANAFCGTDIIGAHDVGAGGIRFKSKNPVNPGALVYLQISFPLFTSPVNCIGRVLRVDQLSYSKWYFVAAVFTEITTEEREKLDTAIETYYSEKG
ncbi:MAG: PilZ domain-containing protein [Candidatus Omnitrophica bacterium]|nr:PilZ domain-containing protein [Candidatus Omnitrophota bacterium]MDD5488728.1 PilZ domain-containing protein [Candidatus Omnitrophota bacterium]